MRKESAAKRRLLDAVTKLLEKYPPGEITTTMVLKEANVARNTLYLHFDNQAALIESALLSIFLDGVRAHADMFEQLLSRTKSKSEFLRHAVDIIRVSQAQNHERFELHDVGSLHTPRKMRDSQKFLASSRARSTIASPNYFPKCTLAAGSIRQSHLLQLQF